MGTNTIEVMVYNETEGKIYLDDEFFGTVSTYEVSRQAKLDLGGFRTFASDNWVLLNSYVKAVSWEEGSAAAAVAAAIAIVLAFTGAGAIVSMVEATLLCALALHSRGGSVSNSVYKLPLATDHTLKEVWSVTSHDGVTIGPYTSYTPT